MYLISYLLHINNFQFNYNVILATNYSEFMERYSEMVILSTMCVKANSPTPVREESKNGGSHLDLNQGSPTPQCTVHPWHSDVAARAGIPYPYETHFCDIIRLSAFSSLPLVGFFGLWTVRVKGLTTIKLNYYFKKSNQCKTIWIFLYAAFCQILFIKFVVYLCSLTSHFDLLYK